MADIFREIDEDLRRDRAQQLWQKYGIHALAAALLIVFATMAFVGWREWREAERRSEGAQLVAAADLAEQGRPEDAIAALEAFAAEAGEGYPLLARLNKAALQSEQGDTAGAAATYEQVAADSGAPPLYRDLAVVLLALNSAATADPQAMIARLEPIAADGNPMRYSALELTALYERRAGNMDRAKEIYGELSEAAAAPAGLRQRASEMLRLMGEGAAAEGAG